MNLDRSIISRGIIRASGNIMVSIESNISALEAKIILLKNQKCKSEFLKDLKKVCSEISEYKIKEYENLSAMETNTLIKKETSAIGYYSFLVFFIFADCENDGFNCSDRAINFREMIQSLDNFQLNNEWATKYPILFVINDYNSKGFAYSMHTKISSIFISVNLYSETQILETFGHIIHNCGKDSNVDIETILNRIGKNIAGESEKESNNLFKTVQSIGENQASTSTLKTDSPLHDFMDNSQEKIQIFAKTVYSVSSKADATIFEKNSGNNFLYTNNPFKHRKCLVFKYNFDNDNIKKFEESDKDEQILFGIFKLLGFTINENLNITYEGMVKLLKAFISQERDLLAVCLLTFCEEEHFHCIDRKVKFRSITKILGKSLSKPKMLFVMNTYQKIHDDFQVPPYYLLHDRIKLPQNFILFYSDCSKSSDYSKMKMPNIMTSMNRIYKRFKNSNSLVLGSEKFKLRFISSLYDTFKNFAEIYDLETIIRITQFKNMFSLYCDFSSIQPQNVFFKSTLKNAIFLKALDNLFPEKIDIRSMNIHSPPNEEENISLDNIFESYPINRGVCLLLKMQDFQKESPKEKIIVDLKNIFQSLGFEKIVEIQHKNVDFMSAPELLLEMTINAETYDCFVLIMITNGNPDNYQILEEFIKLPNSTGNPKLIFVFDTELYWFSDPKISQSSSLYASASTSSLSSSRSNSALVEDSKSKTIERYLLSSAIRYRDYMLFYTLQDSQSNNSLSILRDVFKKFSKTTDLISMMTIVCEKLYPLNDKRKRSMHFLHSSLTRLVYFQTNSQEKLSTIEKSKKEMQHSFQSNCQIASLNQGNQISSEKICVIFANENVKENISEMDYKSNLLKNTFEKLNFSVTQHNSLTRFQFLDELNNILKENYSNKKIDCFVIFFIGQCGIKDELICNQGQSINRRDVIQSLTKNPTLNETPKLFFFETWEGPQGNLGDSITDTISLTLKSPYNDSLFIYSDVFIFSYFRSNQFQNGNNNLKFIRTFCKVLEKHHQTKDFLSMVKMAFNLMAMFDCYMSFSSSLKQKIFF